MKPELLHFLCCPLDHKTLALIDEKGVEGEIDSGGLRCPTCQRIYAIEQGIPRFVTPLAEDEINQVKIRDQESGNSAFVFSRFNREVELLALAKSIRLHADTKILDAGCGVGDCTEKLSTQGGNIFSCDFSFQTLLHLKKRSAAWPQKNVHLIQADTMSLPFLNGFFERVVSGGVLQHLENRKQVNQAILELERVTKNGGKIILTLFQYSKTLDWISKFLYRGEYQKEGKWDNGLHYYRYHKNEITNLFKNNATNIKIRTLKHLPDRLGTILGKGGLALETLLAGSRLLDSIGSYLLVIVTRKETVG